MSGHSISRSSSEEADGWVVGFRWLAFDRSGDWAVGCLTRLRMGAGIFQGCTPPLVMIDLSWMLVCISCPLKQQWRVEDPDTDTLGPWELEEGAGAWMVS